MNKTRWKNMIDAFLKANAIEPLGWDEIIRLEGGMHDEFPKTVQEAAKKTDSMPGMRFASDQTDFSFYESPYYLYSLLFGWLVQSRGTYVSVMKHLGPVDLIADFGGSFATAEYLATHGAKGVIVENIPSWQTVFIEYVADALKLNIAVVRMEEISGVRYGIASEYFEHSRTPEDAFRTIMTGVGIQRLYESSSFCMPAYGHFIPIHIDGVFHSTRRTANRAWAQSGLLNRLATRERIPCWNRVLWHWCRHE